MAGPVLHLAIEEASRELTARLLIALLAVDRGFEVWLGAQWALWENWSALPPGVVLFKGNNHVQAARMQEAARSGHAVAAIEEEALGINDPHQILRSYHPLALDHCRLFLVPGETEGCALAARHPAAAGRIVAVGNPRCDLLGPALRTLRRREAEAIRARHGDFLLINTNHASINPKLEDCWRDFQECVGVGLFEGDGEHGTEAYFTWCAWERANLHALVELIGRLRAAGAPFPIIVRPHPSENLDSWRRALDGMPGVSVIREGDHIPWTMAARMLAHTSCTTGLEAFLLGTPALSVTPEGHDWSSKYVSNVVNPMVGSAAAAVPVILDAMAGRAPADDRTARLAALRPHIRVAEYDLAARRIADALARFAAARPPAPRNAGTAPLRRAVWRAEKIDAAALSAAAVTRGLDEIARALGRTAGIDVVETGVGLVRLRAAGSGGAAAHRNSVSTPV